MTQKQIQTHNRNLLKKWHLDNKRKIAKFKYDSYLHSGRVKYSAPKFITQHEQEVERFKSVVLDALKDPNFLDQIQWLLALGPEALKKDKDENKNA